MNIYLSKGKNGDIDVINGLRLTLQQRGHTVKEYIADTPYSDVPLKTADAVILAIPNGIKTELVEPKRQYFLAGRGQHTEAMTALCSGKGIYAYDGANTYIIDKVMEYDTKNWKLEYGRFNISIPVGMEYIEEHHDK